MLFMLFHKTCRLGTTAIFQLWEKRMYFGIECAEFTFGLVEGKTRQQYRIGAFQPVFKYLQR